MRRTRIRRSRWVCWLLLLACSPVAPTESPASVATGRGIDFSWGTSQGGEVSSRSTRGRVTALLFVATFDLASQLMARRLNDVVMHHRPRVNAAAVVMEAPKYATFADVFRTSLELSYPVALADPDTLAGAGPFGDVRVVPALIVLDQEGREISRKAGVLSNQELERMLGRVSLR